jgi:hypothetical protein
MGIPEYVEVTYKGKKYCVCKIHRKESKVLFVIDSDDIDDILLYSWYISSEGRYISSRINEKQLGLHNFVMNRLTHEGKGQKSTIDHINRIGTDNRTENLRIASTSDQNINKLGRKKSMKLPKGSDISLENIPKFVWYFKGKNSIGDRFLVEINTIPGLDDIHWLSTSSTAVSLKFKLEQTKKYLRSLRSKHPNILTDRFKYYSDECISSMKDYNNIIRLSKFDCVKDNLVEIPKVKDLLEEDTKGLTKSEIDLLKVISVDTSNGRKKTRNMPDGCEVTMDDIPKYCYFEPERDKVGAAFYIGSNHPGMNGKRWYTTRKRSYTIDEKFQQLLTKLKEVDDSA